MDSRIAVAAMMALLGVSRVGALDHVAFTRQDRPARVTGKVLVEAQDGGLLVLDRAGVLWAVTPDEKPAHTQDDEPFEPFSKMVLEQQLLKELPAGFRVHHTAHYLIAYNTTPAYAQWCGALFERLYWAFTNYWEKRRFPLHEPAGPLIALVFDDRQSFAQYGRKELGDATSAIIGYYSLATNRMTSFDLTGADARQPLARGKSTAHINQLLQRPEAERTVATIIHEATHQLAFNCGLHSRYANIPLWLSEGIAIYFEAPDLQSAKGWRGVGNVNRVRLNEFRQFVRSRPEDSLQTLLVNDDRFRNSRSASQAYAEAWALTYFLIQKYSAQYHEYLRRMAAKEPLIEDSPQERLEEWRTVFGKSPGEFDAEFLRFMANLQ